MKLKITDEKLDELAQSKSWVNPAKMYNSESYRWGFRAAEQTHQATVDKLMSIIENQQAALETASNYMNNQGQDSTYIEIVIIKTDKMLKELKGAK